MSIELKTFQHTRVKVQAVRYEGPKMDTELTDKFRNEFHFAYGWQGDKHLVTQYRGLKNPHTGDWFIFDLAGRHLIDVMPEDLFQKSFEAVKGELKDG